MGRHTSSSGRHRESSSTVTSSRKRSRSRSARGDKKSRRSREDKSPPPPSRRSREDKSPPPPSRRSREDKSPPPPRDKHKERRREESPPPQPPPRNDKAQRHRETRRHEDRDYRHEDRDYDQPMSVHECAILRARAKEKLKEVDRMEEDLKLKREEVEKAKQDTADLWKIYYTLQQELQTAYDDNTKLQNDKKLLEEELEKKRGTDAGNDPVKLRDELMSLQREKLQMQGKYNEVVLESQRLSDRASSIEPRIAEIEEYTKKLQVIIDGMLEIRSGLTSIRSEVADMSCTREHTERHQRWNSLLLVTSEQAGRLLHKFGPRAERAADLSGLQTRMTELEEKSTREQLAFNERLGAILTGVAAVAAEWTELETETKQCVKDTSADICRVNEQFRRAAYGKGLPANGRTLRSISVALEDVTANLQGAIAAGGTAPSAGKAVLNGAKAALIRVLKMLEEPSQNDFTR